MRANVGRWRRWLLPLAICVLAVCGMMSAVVTNPRVAYAAPQASYDDSTVTFNDPSAQCGNPGATYTPPGNAQVLEVTAVGGAGQDGQKVSPASGGGGSGGHGGQVTAYVEVPLGLPQYGVEVGSVIQGIQLPLFSPLGFGGVDSGPYAGQGGQELFTYGGGASGISTDCTSTWPVLAGGGGAGGDGTLAGGGGAGGDGCAVAENAPAGVSCAGAGNGANHSRPVLGDCGGGGGGSQGSDTAGGNGGGGGSGCVPADGSGGNVGSFMQGGNSGGQHGTGGQGGAGGGGYYGGGGGGGGTDFGAGGGGGGGSSYVSPGYDIPGFLSSDTPQIEPASGNSQTGSVTITPIVIGTTADGAAASTSDTSVTLTAHAFVSSPSPAPGTVNDGTVEFAVNGQDYFGPVDSSGTAAVSVPLSGLGAGTYTYTTFYNLPDGDTIFSSENTGTLFVTAPGVNVTGIGSATANNSTVTATSGGGQPDVSATVTGTGTVTVAEYSADPVNTALPTGGSYFDVHTTTDSSFSSATIVRCNVGTSTTAYWWSGSSWVAASPQSYDPGTGCITVGPLDSSTTSPTTGQLNGTPFGVTPTPATVTVSPETVKYSQTTPLSATVAVSSPYQPVSTASIAGTVDFTLGAIDLGSVSVSSAVGASSVTANLAASPAILQTPSSTAYTITATYTPSSGSYYDGSSGTGALTVTHDDNALAYTGPVVIANGQPATVSATMTANGGAAQVSGRTLTFTLGSGGSAQQCTATTTSSGVGTCTITKVSQPVGPGSVSVSFAGDADYLPSSTSASAMYYSYASSGGFVVGDKSVGAVTPQTISAGPSVTFWSPAWATANVLSGGLAPTSFKGYETSLTVLSVGATWTASPGNSSPPPKTALPAYLGVIVTSKVTQPGSTITGNVVHVVVLHITSAPNGTGSVPGVGTVVATAS